MELSAFERVLLFGILASILYRHNKGEWPIGIERKEVEA